MADEQETSLPEGTEFPFDSHRVKEPTHSWYPGPVPVPLYGHGAGTKGNSPSPPRAVAMAAAAGGEYRTDE
ncbi:hypothetical protein NHX12_025779 [Muraenolepis orangiensis]|uniref:Uncharacterized protein n=1 Tax=Muraenolepis orangiensis TaxID=630683 RepID=A0A9Q0EFA5_9TELE|nr:hypothetical protein NHX12_025779 [Muraenolepis orangiensis]